MGAALEDPATNPVQVQFCFPDGTKVVQPARPCGAKSIEAEVPSLELEEPQMVQVSATFDGDLFGPSTTVVMVPAPDVEDLDVHGIPMAGGTRITAEGRFLAPLNTDQAGGQVLVRFGEQEGATVVTATHDATGECLEFVAPPAPPELASGSIAAAVAAPPPSTWADVLEAAVAAEAEDPQDMDRRVARLRAQRDAAAAVDPFSVELFVSVDGGCTWTDTDESILYLDGRLRITSVSPSCASVGGGTRLRIEGIMLHRVPGFPVTVTFARPQPGTHQAAPQHWEVQPVTVAGECVNGGVECDSPDLRAALAAAGYASHEAVLGVCVKLGKRLVNGVLRFVVHERVKLAQVRPAL